MCVGTDTKTSKLQLLDSLGHLLVNSVIVLLLDTHFVVQDPNPTTSDLDIPGVVEELIILIGHILEY